MTIPHIIAKLKSFIMLPPNINRANKAKIVVAVVFIVLDKVSLIDLGKEGGHHGGEIIAQGSPEEILKNKESYTGIYLSKYLN